MLVFLPEELRSVKGPPAARRRALDRLIEGADAGYTETLSGYLTAVAQRNALLRRVRSGVAAPGGLMPWDRTCVELGARVVRARVAAVAALTTPFADWLRALGGGAGGRLALEHSPASLDGVEPDGIEDALDALFARTREPRRPCRADPVRSPS